MRAAIVLCGDDDEIGPEDFEKLHQAEIERHKQEGGATEQRKISMLDFLEYCRHAQGIHTHTHWFRTARGIPDWFPHRVADSHALVPHRATYS